MEITKVEYRKLFSLGNYENEVIGAESAVGPDRDPDAELTDLIAWVEAKHQARSLTREADEQLERETYEARIELRNLTSSLAQARIKWDAAKDFLAKHGLDAEFDDIPF